MPAFFGKKKKDEPQDPFDIMRMMDEMIRRSFEDFGRMDTDIEEMRRSLGEGNARPEEIFKKFNIKPGKPMVYGFSFRVGPDGKPQVEEFGNVQPEQKTVKNEREPLVDVINNPAGIKVLAELPGVEKSEIKLDVTGENDVLLIEVPGKFRKRLKLPAKVKPKHCEAHYKNGVLEVTLIKEKEDMPEGAIKVE